MTTIAVEAAPLAREIAAAVVLGETDAVIATINDATDHGPVFAGDVMHHLAAMVRLTLAQCTNDCPERIEADLERVFGTHRLIVSDMETSR